MSIESGLQARQKSKVTGATSAAYDGPGAEGELPDLSIAPKTPAELQELAGHAQRLADRAADTRRQIESKLAQSLKNFESVADQLGLKGADRSKHIAKAARDERRKLLETSDKNRFDLLRELQAIERRAVLAELLFQSPVAMLSVEGLGAPERTALEAQFRNAGPQELATYARHAEAHGDKVMAAALLGAVSRMPRDKRPFSAQHLAERVVGKDFAAVQASIQAVKNRSRETFAADRALRAGRSSAASNVGAALARRKEAALATAGAEDDAA